MEYKVCKKAYEPYLFMVIKVVIDVEVTITLSNDDKDENALLTIPLQNLPSLPHFVSRFSHSFQIYVDLSLFFIIALGSRKCWKDIDEYSHIIQMFILREEQTIVTNDAKELFHCITHLASTYTPDTLLIFLFSHVLSLIPSTFISTLPSHSWHERNEHHSFSQMAFYFLLYCLQQQSRKNDTIFFLSPYFFLTFSRKRNLIRKLVCMVAMALHKEYIMGGVLSNVVIMKVTMIALLPSPLFCFPSYT